MRHKTFRKLLLSTLTAGSLITGASVTVGVFLPSVSFAAEAVIPRIVSVSADKTEVKPGDTVQLTAVPTPDTDVNDVQLTITSKTDGDFSGRVVYMSKQSDGSLSGAITIDDSWPNGETAIDNVYVGDYTNGSGTYYTYFNNKDDTNDYNRDISEILFSGFTVNSSAADTQGPVINSVTFDKKDLKPGDTVKITLNTTDQSKIEPRSIDVSFIYRKNEGDDYNTAIVSFGRFSEPDTSGNMTSEIKIDDTWKNGTYDIYTVSAYDEYSNRTELGGADTFKKLFDGFSVSGSKELNETNSEDPYPSNDDPDVQVASEDEVVIKEIDREAIQEKDNRFYELNNKYFGFPFVIENDKGENLSANTGIELYKLIDGKEVKVDNFVQASMILNPYYSTGAESGERFLSTFDMYKLDIDDIADALENANGEYIIKCVNVPNGYERFSDISFKLNYPNPKFETHYAKGLISEIKANKVDAFIAKDNPGYIKDHEMMFTSDEPTIRPSDRDYFDQKTDRWTERYQDMLKYDSIASEYDLFTIVLKRSASSLTGTEDAKNENTTGRIVSGEKTASTSLVKAAPTGDGDSSVILWIVTGTVSVAAAGAIISIMRKKLIDRV